MVTDVSDAYAMLNVQGPASRALLQELSTDDFSAAAFPFATCREVRIGYQSAARAAPDVRGRARLGALHPHLVRPAGLRCADRGRQGARTASLRLPHAQLAADREGLSRLAARHRTRGYTARGGSCLHLRLEQTRRIRRPRGAPRAARRHGVPQRRLVQFLLEDPEPLLYHNEPIYRDGERVGFVTSGMYGHTLGARGGARLCRARATDAAMQYVLERPLRDRACRTAKSRASSLAPMYDPKNLRVRA